MIFSTYSEGAGVHLRHIQEGGDRSTPSGRSGRSRTKASEGFRYIGSSGQNLHL